MTFSAGATFVHPDAFDLLRGGALREPIDDPDLRRRVTAYLADQQAITIRYHNARTTDDRDAALHDLLTHADTNRLLIDEVIQYQARRGNFAQPPEGFGTPNDDATPPTKPAAPARRRRNHQTKIRLAQTCYTESRTARLAPGRAHALRLRPRAHAHQHRTIHQGGPIYRAGAVTIPSPTAPGTWFRGSTPHRYAARHRRSNVRPRSRLPTSMYSNACAPLTATVTATQTDYRAPARTTITLRIRQSPPTQPYPRHKRWTSWPSQPYSMSHEVATMARKPAPNSSTTDQGQLARNGNQPRHVDIPRDPVEGQHLPTGRAPSKGLRRTSNRPIHL
jgi:hypothetical protein